MLLTRRILRQPKHVLRGRVVAMAERHCATVPVEGAVISPTMQRRIHTRDHLIKVSRLMAVRTVIIVTPTQHHRHQAGNHLHLASQGLREVHPHLPQTLMVPTPILSTAMHSRHPLLTALSISIRRNRLDKTQPMIIEGMVVVVLIMGLRLVMVVTSFSCVMSLQ